jgi:hypothetical protein
MTEFRFDDAYIALSKIPQTRKAITLIKTLFGFSATLDTIDIPSKFNRNLRIKQAV